MIFLTEMTSNLATTATFFLPVIGAMAIESGIDPMVLCVPVTLAASCAFMLPVATAPNAIAFSSGLISIPQMARAGLLLNCAGYGAANRGGVVVGAVILCSVLSWPDVLKRERSMACAGGAVVPADGMYVTA